MWLRVSIGLHGTNIEKVKETYNLMSKNILLTNQHYLIREQRQQNASCFLLGTEDSVEGF